MFIFTDYVQSIDVKAKFGYLMICTILLNFGVNILIQVICGLSLLPRVCARIRLRVESWTQTPKAPKVPDPHSVKKPNKSLKKPKKKRAKTALVKAPKEIEVPGYEFDTIGDTFENTQDNHGTKYQNEVPGTPQAFSQQRGDLQASQL